MVVIPEGYALIGGEGSENSPAHEAVIARFLMDATEVTVDAYASCTQAGKCKPMHTDNPFCNVHFEGRGSHPVNCIDWNDAAAYCELLGKRLPTEHEWEYAARGGSEGRLYSWGNEEPDARRSCYMHNGGSCPVAQFPAGAFGLFDMTGNVWEWTSSWYGPYPGEAETGLFKVYRGGSWSRRFSKWMRNDLRNRFKPEEEGGSLGMRCAKSITPLICPKEAEAQGGRCVRISGAALCPKGEAFAAGACRPGGVVPAWAVGSATAPQGILPGMAHASASATTRPEDLPPKRVRAASFDADCQAHYPGLPSAYQWVNGTFQAREPLIRAAGCKKRDIGVGWSSACCPN